MTITAEQKEWTLARLRDAVTAGTHAEKVALLKQIGVLTKKGTLRKHTQDWGDKPTRTPEFED